MGSKTNWAKVSALAAVGSLSVTFLAYAAPHPPPAPLPGPTSTLTTAPVAPPESDTATSAVAPSQVPTTTTNPPTTTGFDPTSLDNVTTDPTPLTAAAMFPPTITDQLGSLFALSANTMMPCVTPSMTSNVQNALTSNGCSTALGADYVGPGAQGADSPILVSIEVIPFASSTTAQRVADNFWGLMKSGAWWFGLVCPQSGTGANLCTGGRYNNVNTYVALQHRYVIVATALYADGTTPVDNWTYMAPGALANGCGPSYYISTR